MKVDQRIAPITEDDAAIASALESASIPTLMMSMVHITGDASWLRGDVRPRPAVMGEIQGFLSEEEKARVRRDALAVLAAWRDGGCKVPPPPSPETIREMMSFMVGEPVPDEYAGMVWSHPGMNNCYKNSKGHVITTSPWRLVDYWRWTREPDLRDYELR